ncbi:MAG: hypothetical protein LBI12_07845 [Treponema sp.]|nr:hypothetical protein [Treponema sp.]
MKKSALLFLIIPLFLSCYIGEFSLKINQWDETVITNNSSHTVMFKFSNTGEFTLEPGEQTTFEPVPHQHIEYYLPEEVTFSYKAGNDGSTGEFKDLPKSN